MGTTARALAALEVAVAGAGGTLAGLEPIGIHRQAHAATRLTPLRAGLGEDAVQALGLGLMANLLASRNDQGADTSGYLSSLKNLGRGPQVFDSPVRARPDEDDVHGDLADRRTRFQAHVLESPVRLATRRSGDLGRVRHATGHIDGHGRVRAPGDLGNQCGRVDLHMGIKARVVLGVERLPVGDGGFQVSALRCERPMAAGNVLDRGVIRSDQTGAVPASIDMLQTVMRPSIDKAEITGP